MYGTTLKLMLVGISQFGCADRRTNIKHGNCGVALGSGLVFPSAANNIKPHQPLATKNRIDNNGNWSEGT